MAANLDSGVQLVVADHVVAAAQFRLAHYPVVVVPHFVQFEAAVQLIHSQQLQIAVHLELHQQLDLEVH